MNGAAWRVALLTAGISALGGRRSTGPTPPEFRFTAIDTVNGASRPLGTWNAELDTLAATYGRVGFFDGRRWVIQPVHHT